MKKRQIISIGLSLFLLGALNACDDKPEENKVYKTASEDNFKHVLNRYFKQYCIGIEINAKLPAYERVDSVGKVASKYLDLEKLGLVKLTDAKFDIDKEEKRRGEVNLFGDSDKVRMVDGKKVELTEKGKKIYKEKEKVRSYSQAEFCLANYEIVKVTNYTKPQSIGPITLSRVNYKAKPINVVPFISDLNKTEYLGSMVGMATSEVSKSAELVLTEMKGWMHIKEYKDSK